MTGIRRGNGPLMAQAWLTRAAVRGNDLPCPPKRWPSACSTEVARRASCGSAGPATDVSGCWPLHPARLLADHRDPRWINRLGGTPAGLANVRFESQLLDASASWTDDRPPSSWTRAVLYRQCFNRSDIVLNHPASPPR